MMLMVVELYILRDVGQGWVAGFVWYITAVYMRKSPEEWKSRDGITAEMLKDGGDSVVDRMHLLICRLALRDWMEVTTYRKVNMGTTEELVYWMYWVKCMAECYKLVSGEE